MMTIGEPAHPIVGQRPDARRQSWWSCVRHAPHVHAVASSAPWHQAQRSSQVARGTSSIAVTPLGRTARREVQRSNGAQMRRPSLSFA